MNAALRLSGECPKCRSPLVRRKRRSDNQPFLSCTAYPNCKFAEDWDPHVTALADEVADLRADMASMRAELARARTRGVDSDFDKKLRDVIVFAHPDRWPNAQELAHEITTRLNVLRGRR